MRFIFIIQSIHIEMTIRSIYQVLGYRISGYTLFKYLLQTNEVFKKKLMDNILGKMMGLDNDDNLGQYISETVFEAQYNLNDYRFEQYLLDPNDKIMGCYAITHDVSDDLSFIVGIKINEYNYSHTLRDDLKTKEADGTNCDLEQLQKSMATYTQKLKDMNLIANDAAPAKIYNLQDDCECCS
jgi:hypothetical protein